MKLSRVSMSVKLNTNQPELRDEVWWNAVKYFVLNK